MVWKVLTGKVCNTVVSRVGEGNQLENSQQNQMKNKISIISVVDKPGLVDLWHSLALSKWEQAESGGLGDKSIYITFWQILSKMCFANVTSFSLQHMDLFSCAFTVQHESCRNCKNQQLLRMGAPKSKHIQMKKNIYKTWSISFNLCPVHWK